VKFLLSVREGTNNIVILFDLALFQCLFSLKTLKDLLLILKDKDLSRILKWFLTDLVKVLKLKKKCKYFGKDPPRSSKILIREISLKILRIPKWPGLLRILIKILNNNLWRSSRNLKDLARFSLCMSLYGTLHANYVENYYVVIKNLKAVYFFL